MLAFALLSQSAPPLITSEWQAGLISFGVIVLIALNIWDKVKRKPPLEDTFAKKGEIQNAKEERESIRGELKSLDERTDRKIEALDRRRETGEKENRDLLHREVASMKEFISDKISENRENNTSAFGKIEGRLDSFQVSMQGLSNDVMHQIGSLEGQLKEVAKRVA